MSIKHQSDIRYALLFDMNMNFRQTLWRMHGGCSEKYYIICILIRFQLIASTRYSIIGVGTIKYQAKLWLLWDWWWKLCWYIHGTGFDLLIIKPWHDKPRIIKCNTQICLIFFMVMQCVLNRKKIICLNFIDLTFAASTMARQNVIYFSILQYESQERMWYFRLTVVLPQLYVKMCANSGGSKK